MHRDCISTTGPSLAVWRNTLYVAYRGCASAQLWWSFYDGNAWSPDSRIRDYSSSTGASLVTFHNALYITWKSDQDSSICYAKFDGSAWGPVKQTDFTTATRPSVTVWGDRTEQKLFMSWRGDDMDENIYYSFFDGSSWAPIQKIPNAVSSEGPALVYFRGAIHAVWKGGSEDETIWHSFLDSVSWSEPRPLGGPIACTFTPSLVVFQEQLYVAWKGREGDTRIWWTRTSGQDINANLTSGYGVNVPVGSQPVASYDSRDVPAAGASIGSGDSRDIPIEDGSRNTEKLPITAVTEGSVHPDSSRTERAYVEESDISKITTAPPGSDMYGLADIKKGVKKGVKKGKEDLSEMFSKLRHKKDP